MFCTKCGNQVNGSLSFCPKCGNPINSQQGNYSNAPSQSRGSFPAWIKPLVIILIFALVGFGAYSFFGKDNPEAVAKKLINNIVDKKYESAQKLYSHEYISRAQLFGGKQALLEGLETFNQIIVGLAKESASSFSYSTHKISDTKARVTAASSKNRIVFTFDMAKFDDKWLITADGIDYSPEFQKIVLDFMMRRLK